MTSLHNAPYATQLVPKFEIGQEVFCTRLRRSCTIYGVRVCRVPDGSFRVYYLIYENMQLLCDSWYAEGSFIESAPYVRDRLGYCVFVGNTVHDLMSRHGSGELVVSKIDASSKRCFLKRSPTSSFGYWCKAGDLCKVADCYRLS